MEPVSERLAVVQRTINDLYNLAIDSIMCGNYPGAELALESARKLMASDTVGCPPDPPNPFRPLLDEVEAEFDLERKALIQSIANRAYEECAVLSEQYGHQDSATAIRSLKR